MTCFFLDEVHCVEENLTKAVTKSEWIGRRQWQLLSRLEGLNEHCAWKDRWKKSGCWSQCDLSLSDEMPLFFQTPPVCLSSLWCRGVVQEHCQNTVRPLSAMVQVLSSWALSTALYQLLPSELEVVTASVTLHDTYNCQNNPHCIFGDDLVTWNIHWLRWWWW